MSAQPTLTRKIFDAIAANNGPISQPQIADAVAEPTDDRVRLRTVVAALLLQQTERKKLKRTGLRGAYLYETTATTFIDLRTLPRELGKPRAAIAKPKRPAVVIKAVPVKEAKQKAATKPVQAPASDTHRFPIARPTTTPRKSGERETVAEFEARGGRIQKLAHGESSQPAYQSVRDVDQRSMRTRLQKALDTDPANTTDDNAVAA